MKILVVPVGIDSKEGEQYGPILEDGSFIFVPFPEFSIEDNKKKNTIKRGISMIRDLNYDLRPYSEIPVEPLSEHPDKKFMGDYLLDKDYKGHPIRSYIPHADPDFKHFTYGEGSDKKAKALTNLKEDDMIVFYSSLCKPYRNQFQAKYLIGYFTIEDIYDFRFSNKELKIYIEKDIFPIIADIRIGKRDEVYKYSDDRFKPLDIRVKHNFHIIRGDGIISDKNGNKTAQPIIAVGKPDKSRLFPHALQFTNKNMEILDKFMKFWSEKYTNRLIRGLRYIEGEKAEKFKAFILSYD